MIKYLQKQEYSSRTKVFVKEKVEHVTFNFTLENQVHRQGEYFNDKWVVFYSSLVFAFWMTANPLELGFMSVRCLLVQRLMNEFIQTELACGGRQQMRCKYKWGSEMFYSKHWFDCMKALGTFSCSTSLSLMFPLTLPFQPELCMWFQMLQIYSIMLISDTLVINHLFLCLFASSFVSVCSPPPCCTCSFSPCLHSLIPLFLHVFACRFMNLKMKSMVFEDSLFEECYFEDITSTNTFFKNCTFIATLFYNTGREHTYKHSQVFYNRKIWSCISKTFKLEAFMCVSAGPEKMQNKLYMDIYGKNVMLLLLCAPVLSLLFIDLSEVSL